ncbi:oleoyl-acyl carrier protein thioesterase, chloroplastic-like [Cynara cardunculus var. scolymus]|uniref:oleoyl-acyl carrier protein thioesterase, chloroplastic-like n=1 Tax=Cynara cardunculus var. scolymus TaxID=59895 RepID=UPI000D62A229|nr:oleoyl-acyl carrier protein thioesterase, chloroplastic-like [Cynara cardunculus var. scolymus]
MLSKGSPVAPAIYNASAKDATCALTQSRSIGSVSIRRKYNVFLCNLSSRKVSPLLAVATGEQPSGLASLHEAEKEKSLGNRLRLGSLTEDGLSYKEKFIIRCYEVGINKTATIETIANLLQEVGGNHAQSVGFSTDGFATTTTMRKLHLIWVTARMHIEVYRYPAWSDVIEIETWVQGDGRIGTRRDWILKDYANGEVIGRATSKWVMMNEDTRRLQKVSDDVREEYLVFCPRTLRLAFPEENNNSLKKIAKLEDPAEYSRLGLVPRRSDLDMNKHVNNVTYIGWALESIPPEIIDTHELQAITLDYRRECQRDDIVDSLTSREPLEDAEVIEFTGCNGSVPSKKDEQDLSRFMHLLRSSGNGLEINRCRTEWRKKPAKR